MSRGVPHWKPSLFGAVASLIAAKYEEGRYSINLIQFKYASLRKRFTLQDLVTAEVDFLKGIDYNMDWPSESLPALQSLLEGSDKHTQRLSRLFLLVSLLTPELAYLQPDCRASSCFLLASHVATDQTGANIYIAPWGRELATNLPQGSAERSSLGIDNLGIDNGAFTYFSSCVSQRLGKLETSNTFGARLTRRLLLLQAPFRSCQYFIPKTKRNCRNSIWNVGKIDRTMACWYQSQGSIEELAHVVVCKRYDNGGCILALSERWRQQIFFLRFAIESSEA